MVQAVQGERFRSVELDLSAVRSKGDVRQKISICSSIHQQLTIGAGLGSFFDYILRTFINEANKYESRSGSQEADAREPNDVQVARHNNNNVRRGDHRTGNEANREAQEDRHEQPAGHLDGSEMCHQ